MATKTCIHPVNLIVKEVEERPSPHGVGKGPKIKVLVERCFGCNTVVRSGMLS